MHMEVRAELRVPIATAQILRFDLPEHFESSIASERRCVLDLSLTPRPAKSQARFLGHWDKRRFETAGEIFMLPPNEAVEWRAEPCQETSVACALEIDALPAWLDGALDWPERELPASLDLRSAALRQLMFRMYEELRNPGFAASAMVELLATQIAIEVARLGGRAERASSTSGLSPWRLRQIDERLAEGDPPSLAELATLCGLSVRQLTRAFRVSRGCTVGDYVAQRRAEAAKHLLRSDMSVKAIARALGFGSPAGFTYAFRQVVGMTPQQFRAEIIEL